MSPSSNVPKAAAPKPVLATFDLYDDDTGRIQPHEPLSHYVVGGFHPTALGDTFSNGRYVVHRKLGYGGRSTVWLATDKAGQDPSKKKNYVSIKIKSASSSTLGLNNDPEIVKLRQLESHYSRGPQGRPRSYVRLLDCFVHNGPNGKHNCLVTELLGPSLGAVMIVFRELGQVLRPDTILRSSRQIFEAIDFAHQAGFVHGDVSAANVAFTCNAIQDDEDDGVLGSLSELSVAKAIKPLPSSHVPKELVATSVWDLWDDGPTEDIRLIDWGEAFAFNATVSSKDMAQPNDLRAPETFFIGRFDYRHDFWRAGCVVYNLVHQERIFGVLSTGQHFFLCKMMEKLGPFPSSWQAKFQEIRKTNRFADKEEANIEKQLIADTFGTRRRTLVSIYNDDEADNPPESDEHTNYDLDSLSQLLQPMKDLLRYQPEMRITAKQASALVKWVDHRRGQS